MTRVLVVYNEPVLGDVHPDAESEREILQTVQAVIEYLVCSGFEVEQLGVGRDPGVLLAGIRSKRPDVVFNLFEGTADHGSTESYLAGLLDWIGVPFTGSPATALALARQKHLSKALFHGAGLPTPGFLSVTGTPVRTDLKWPLIVKPGLEDASVGLDHGSVVSDSRALNDRVGLLLHRYGHPILVEEYIAGRELNVAVVETTELRALAPSEVVFVNQEPGDWPIVTYDAKWKPGSPDYVSTPTQYPARVTADIAQTLQALAIDAFRLIGCRDYARVDFRVRESGEPFILEVNPNPDYHPTAGLAAGLACAGVSHREFTETLIRNALRRSIRAMGGR